MSASPAHQPDAFDAVASRYDEVLNRGLAVTGEAKEYFALARVAWVERHLGALGRRAARILDYGCGTGTTIPLLRAALAPDALVGADVSRASLDEAARRHAAADTRFCHLDELPVAPPFDLVFSNGVFHHIPPSDRDAALASIAAHLAPGGFLALWENNPFNPGTRWVMQRLPFDRDAIMLTPSESRRRVRRAGLRVLATDYLFFFPRALRWLRPLEPRLSSIPLGGQYLVLAVKPAGAGRGAASP